MGLKINTFKKFGMTFTDAYAKVMNVVYNNNSKIATFNIAVYPNQSSLNVICITDKQLSTVVEPGVDIVAQCYQRVNVLIAETRAKITLLESQADLLPEQQNQIEELKYCELMNFEGATEQ
jgi:hypothetical protein